MTKSKREALGQIVIRPPEGMRERIKAAAEANNRSMNAEIVAALEEKYPAVFSPSGFMEAAIADRFRAAGWTIIPTGAQSGVDFIIERDELQIAIECKNRSSAVTPSEILSLPEKRLALNVNDIWIFAIGGFSQEAVEAAKKAEVALIDASDDLETMRMIDLSHGSPTTFYE
ncbi:MAG: restriction endonuclease [Paracoccus aminovorans]|nr:restriction endonuclease [Paracoccus aminovorans]